MMNVLIIEDEPRAARQLQNLLKKSDFNFTLLEVIDTVEDSIKWFAQHSPPDLVFMDIQLADGLSFEIFQKIEVNAPIIFTTAFDQYAIQAFKVNSVDYLLKPIQQQDLDLALKKFEKSKASSGIPTSILKDLLGSLQEPQKRSGILVREGNDYVQIKLSELLYVYSEDSVTFGVTEKRRYILSETIDQLFSSLDAKDFYQINRGQIVSKSAIQKFSPYFNSRVKLQVSNSRDQEFVVSRQKTSDFKEWMNR